MKWNDFKAQTIKTFRKKGWLIINHSFAIVIILILFSTFMVGTFLDLSIAENVYSKDNIFGIIFDHVGKWIWMLPLLAGYLIIGQSLRHHYNIKVNKWIELGLYVLIVFLILFLSLGLDLIDEVKGNEDQNKTLSFIANILIGICVAAWMYFRIQNGPVWIKEDKQIMRKVIIMFAIIIVMALSTTILKMVFARPRPVTVFDGKEAYREWWNIHYTGSNNSFPSGHTTSGMTLISVCILYNKNSSKYFKYMFSGIIVTILIATSRMVLGAHFLSDVMGAMLFSYGWFALFEYLNTRQLKWLDKLIVVPGGTK